MKRAARALVTASASALGGCLLFTSLDDVAGGSTATAADAGVDHEDDAVVPDAGIPEAAADASLLPLPPSSRYRAAVLEDQPLAYFRLSDPAGTVQSKGEVDHGYTLLYATTTAGGVEGVFGASGDKATHVASTEMILDGPEGSATFDFPGRAPYTFEIWIKMDVTGAAGSFLDDLTISPGPDTGLNVFVQGDKSIRAERWVAKTLWRYAIGGALVDSTRFHHVVLTFDGTDDRLYVDRLTGEHYEVGAAGTMPGNNKAFRVTGSGLVVDELAVYDKALPEARVRAHFAAATDP